MSADEFRSAPDPHSAIRVLARELDGRFSGRRVADDEPRGFLVRPRNPWGGTDLTLARDVDGDPTRIRATLAKHFPSWDLGDTSLPLFCEALEACEATS